MMKNISRLFVLFSILLLQTLFFSATSFAMTCHAGDANTCGICFWMPIALQFNLGQEFMMVVSGRTVTWLSMGQGKAQRY